LAVGRKFGEGSVGISIEIDFRAGISL